MTDIFRQLISSPGIRAYVLAAIRHVVTAGGAALLTWLVSKGLAAKDAGSIVEDLSGVAMILASFAFSMLDVQKVGSKIAAVAAAPTSPAQTIQDLKAGKFG